MFIASAARTVVAAAYLLALAVHGRPAVVTALLAVALLGVCAVPLLRDAVRARQARSIRSGSSAVSPRPTGWIPVRPWSRARVR
jgi:uncharacterized membrane protein